MNNDPHPLLVGSDPERFTPFVAEVGSSRWHVVTNGYAAYLTPSVAEPTTNERLLRYVSGIKTMLDTAGPIVAQTTIAALRSLCGELPPGVQIAKCDCKPVECSGCNGDGTKYCIDCEEDHECGCCEGAGTRPCDRCEDGVVATRSDLPSVRIGTAIVGAPLLRAAIAVAPDGPVVVHHAGGLDPVHFVGSGWRAIVAPIRDTNPIATLDATPTEATT